MSSTGGLVGRRRGTRDYLTAEDLENPGRVWVTARAQLWLRSPVAEGELMYQNGRVPNWRATIRACLKSPSDWPKSSDGSGVTRISGGASQLLAAHVQVSYLPSAQPLGASATFTAALAACWCVCVLCQVPPLTSDTPPSPTARNQASVFFVSQ